MNADLYTEFIPHRFDFPHLLLGYFATPDGVCQCFCHSPGGAHFGDASNYNTFAI